MPWTKKDYPDSMKNLDTKVRNKAIDIANAILEEDKHKDEGIVIATAISRAKDWAANREDSDKKSGRGKKSTSSGSSSRSSDKRSASDKSGSGKSSRKTSSSASGKSSGGERPGSRNGRSPKSDEKKKSAGRKTDVKEHGKDQYVSPAEDGWAVKEEGEEERKVYRKKSKAVGKATEKAKKANATVTIRNKSGKISKRKSYNPNNKSRK